MWGARISLSLTLLLLIAVAPAHALADDFDDALAALPSGNVVDDADTIFVAKVVAVRHLRRTRRLHGQRARYIARFRIKVRVGRVLRGGDLRDLFGGRRALWIERDNPLIPGRKQTRRRPDPMVNQLAKMQRGTEVLVLLRGMATRGDGPRPGKPLRIINGAIQGIDTLSLVEARIAERHAQYRTTRLDEVSRCKDPDTYVLADSCVARTKVLSATTCEPPLQAAEEALPAGALRIGCKDSDGKWEGQRREWSWDGELHVEAEHRKGLAHGRWRSFHGGTSKVSVEGNMERGLKVGQWTQLDRSGKTLGTYLMVRGTGTETRWTEEGLQAQQSDYRRGREHGHFRNFTEGKLAVVGYHRRGKVHGLFVYMRPDGSVRLATCERRGKTMWERDDPKRIRKCPYGNTKWPL